MNRNRKRCDCNAKTETANAFEPARNHDEKIDEILDEVKERLKEFSCECFNLGEWLTEISERLRVTACAVDSEKVPEPTTPIGKVHTAHAFTKVGESIKSSCK